MRPKQQRNLRKTNVWEPKSNETWGKPILENQKAKKPCENQCLEAKKQRNLRKTNVWRAKSSETLEKPNTNNVLFQGIDFKKEKEFLIAENNNEISEESVLISEIIIKGWENHPEGRKLELAAYDSMRIKPGSVINNQILTKIKQLPNCISSMLKVKNPRNL